MYVHHKALGILFTLIIIAGLVGCSATSKGLEYQYKSDGGQLTIGNVVSYPAARFIVFSDPHIYSPELGMESKALDEYLLEDRKLLRESAEILESLVATIKDETADYVIVSGDLTKDGERVCHELCASYLRQIEADGKPVYVVPGNHDILNPEAFRYSGDTAVRVSNITPEEFSEIYREFGYSDAIYRDSNSLSYVVEPQAGLWLLALDSCCYKENPKRDKAVTDGAFSNDTLLWIESMLIEAAEKQKAVMVTMHHGVTEHYTGQEKYFGDYVVDDYLEISRLFAAYNVRLVFTGHYHAQDITMVRFAGENNFLLDIETGSLVTYPCPYRVMEITAQQKLAIRSGCVTSIKSYPTGFEEYAHKYVKSGLVSIAAQTIEDYGVEAESAEKLAEQVGTAFMAHYAGDEKLSPGQIIITSKGTGLMGWFVVFVRKGMVKGLWYDLYPPDNNITIDLITGQQY
ncbi:MAG: metallophosphoesterase [Sedimentisphaerales bacterium]|nr:metallophosphoesterase [Sedimentisphaerales bacterium]